MGAWDYIETDSKPTAQPKPQGKKGKGAWAYIDTSPANKGDKIGGMKIVAAQSKGSVHFGSHDGPGVYDITEAEAKAKYGSMEKAAAKLSELGYVPRVRYKGQRNIYVNHIHLADPDKADDKEVNRLRSQKDGRPQKYDKADLKKMQAEAPTAAVSSHSSKKAEKPAKAKPRPKSYWSQTPSKRPPSTISAVAPDGYISKLRKKPSVGERVENAVVATAHGIYETTGGLVKAITSKGNFKGAEEAAERLATVEERRQPKTLKRALGTTEGKVGRIAGQQGTYFALAKPLGVVDSTIGAGAKALGVGGKAAKIGESALGNLAFDRVLTSGENLTPAEQRKRDITSLAVGAGMRGLMEGVAGGLGKAGQKAAGGAKSIAPEAQLKQLKSLDEALTAQGHVAPEVKAEIVKLEQVATPKVEPVPTPEPVPTVRKSRTVQPETVVVPEQVAKEPWEMSKAAYEQKGVGLPDGHPIRNETYELNNEKKAIEKQILDIAPKWQKTNFADVETRRSTIGAAHEWSGTGIEDALKKNYRGANKVPMELKQRHAEIDARLQSLSEQADTELSHRTQVESALAEGKPVPPEVLADYPDLAPAVKPEPVVAPKPETPVVEKPVAPKVVKPKLPKTPKPTAPKGELPDDVAEALSRIKQTVRGVAKSERGSFSLKDADDTTQKQFMADVKTVGRHYYGQFAGDAEAWIAAMRESFEETWDSVKPHISKMWAEIDRESQPITPKTKTVPVMEKGQTGASIERINANRADRGLAPVAKQEAQTVGELLDNGKRLVDDNAVNPNALASEIIDKPRPLTGDEVAALAYNRQKLNNELTVLRRQADDALNAGDSAKADSISTQIKKTERAFDDNDAALSYSGTENAQGMYARKVILREDYSMEGLLAQKRRSVNTGRKTVRDLTPEEKAELTALKEQYDRALQKSSEYEAKNHGLAQEIEALDKQLRELRAKESSRPGTKATPKPRVAVKNTLFTDEKYEAAKRIWADRYANPRANVGIDPELMAAAVDIVGWHIERGVRSYAALYAKAKEDIPGIDEATFAEVHTNLTGEARLEAIKKRLVNEIQETNERLGRGQGPKPRMPSIMDDTEALSLRAELEQARTKLKESVAAPKPLTVENVSRRVLFEVAGGYKSAKASMDVSAPGRQGFALGARHPIVWLKAWVPQMKALVSEKQYLIEHERLKANPAYLRAKRAGIAFTEPDAPVGSSQREETFVGGAVDKIWGIRGSSRAYSTYLNNLRLGAFEIRLAQMEKLGIDTVQLEKKIGHVINAFSDRGSLGSFEQAATDLNVAIFSPRRLAGKVQGPLAILSNDPFVRRVAAETLVAEAAWTASLLAMAKLSGLQVETDYLSSQFGQARYGDMRIDLTAGNGSLTRNLMQFLMNSRKIDGKYKPMTSYDNDMQGTRFVRSKLSPLAGLIWTLKTGKDFKGEDIKKAYKEKPMRRLFEDTAPMVWESILEAYESMGTGAAAAAGVLSLGGVGVNTYADRPKKRKKPKGRTGPPSRPKPPTRPTRR